MDLSQFSLTDKVAIVTGSGSGIGKATALTFAKAGANVVSADINKNTAEGTAGAVHKLGREALSIHVDVRDKSQVENMATETIKKFKKVDVLVNNAGYGFITVPLVEMTEEDWDDRITLNLKSTFLCCKIVGKIMKAQKGGVIINMSSMAALGAYPMGSNYSAAKAGIKNLTETLAVELGPHNIRVNALAPGVTLTRLVQDLYAKRPELKALRLTQIPLRRVGTPEDIANVALFLASEASSYVSGQTIAVNGAMATFVTPEFIMELSNR
jgi:3-oxoacyl-[acyl-carrier protein] reductase